MSGVVFHHVAEGVMARHLKLSVEDARDTSSVFIPNVKNGNLLAASYVLDRLGIKNNAQWSGSYSSGNPIWGKTQEHPKEVLLKHVKTYSNIVPDVKGMGARDAVFMLESRGLKTTINGCGKVAGQSIEPGTVVKRGQICILTMN